VKGYQVKHVLISVNLIAHDSLIMNHKNNYSFMLIKGCIQTEIIFADVMQKRQFVSEEYKLFVVGEIHFFCFKLAAGLVLSIIVL